MCMCACMLVARLQVIIIIILVAVVVVVIIVVCGGHLRVEGPPPELAVPLREVAAELVVEDLPLLLVCFIVVIV